VSEQDGGGHSGGRLRRHPVAAGLVAVLALVVVAGALDSGALTRPFTVEARSPHAYYVVCRAAALERSEVSRFVDWLRAEMPAQRSR
jgi:DNA-binding transcriptional LysR family regulator